MTDTETPMRVPEKKTYADDYRTLTRLVNPVTHKINHPKGYAPEKDRDLRGMMPYELASVIKAAETFYAVPGRPGCRDGMTNERLMQTIMFMATTGVQKDIIDHPRFRHLRMTQEGWAEFERTKKKKMKAVTRVALNDAIASWVRDYVEWLVARDGISGRILDRALKEAGVLAGIDRPVNCLLLRHTAGLAMALDGVDESNIAKYLNCTVETAKEHYTNYATNQLEAVMRRKGALRRPPWANLTEESP